jgi:ferric-dicitrate binding protein FerR (iron transport regulator)
MNVISLDRARARLRAQQRIEPPSALGLPARHAMRPHTTDDGEDRLRMRQNAAAFAVIVAIVVLGSWLMQSLQYSSRLQACFEAGHHNCLPLEPRYLSSPYYR